MLRLLVFLLAFSARAAESPVKVWTDKITLPTWLEGLPRSDSPFDAFKPNWVQSFYPYTWRSTFTDKKVDHAWRIVYLENEYLKCSFLPDLGGRLYTCRDKIAGRDMFHANPSVKKQYVGIRGAWAALGIEFNFPVGHSMVNVSPVDFAARANADGSASVFVSSVDRVTGMQWRVESILRPASTVLEQRVGLYNRTDVRRRYYWWANASVQLEDEATTFVLPANLAASHGRTEIDTWPVNSAGIDLSVVGNHKTGGVGLFAHGSREPFFAVYNPHSRTGTVHYADAKAVPGKKVWSWGWAADGNPWVRKNLSDNDTSYVEIQSGLFENQETFEFLGPQEAKSFTEYWMPARNLGGIARANLHGVLNLQRSRGTGGRVTLTVELNVNHPIPGAKTRLLEGARAIREETLDLAPGTAFARTLAELPAASKYRFELADSAGNVLLAHSEGALDALGAPDVKLGKQPQVDRSNPKTEEEFARAAAYQESLSNLDAAYAIWSAGLRAFPESCTLLVGAGRLAVTMNRLAVALPRLTQAAAARNDPEAHYYLGAAFANLGDDGKARVEWDGIRADPQFGPAANLQLAFLLARAHDYPAALLAVRAAAGHAAERLRAGAVEVALLRHLDKPDEAKSRLAFWRAADPADLFLRYEQVRLVPDSDADFWRQLAADPERVLNIVTHLFELGFYEDSLLLTDRAYEPVDPLDTEPGAALPQKYPLVAYYRAFARAKLGRDKAAGDYRAAAGLSTLYVFPSRHGSLPVLQAALAENPNDAAAHFLLGSLYFSFGTVDEAIAEWQKARSLRPLKSNKAEDVRRNLPSLHRDLGRALFEIRQDIPAAIQVLQEAVRIDPGDDDAKDALQKALSAPR